MQLPLLMVVSVLLLKHASADRMGSLSLLLLGIALGDSLHRQDLTHRDQIAKFLSSAQSSASIR
jgi:hypothetical protein